MLFCTEMARVPVVRCPAQVALMGASVGDAAVVGDGAEVGDAAVVVEAAAGIGGSSFLSVAWVPRVMPLSRVSSGWFHGGKSTRGG